MKIIRSHDKLYLKENRYKKPKEIFKFIYNLIKKSNHNKNKKVIADFGFAAGEFLFFLKSRINCSCKLIGLDIDNSLLKKARKKVKNVIFLKLNILKRDNKYKNFENYNRDKFAKFSKKNFSFYKKYLNKNRLFQSGWNVLSKASMKNYLEYHPQVKKFTFHDFKINRNISPHKEDPIRSWTFKYNNRTEITNGLGLIQKHCFAIIEL